MELQEFNSLYEETTQAIILEYEVEKHNYESGIFSDEFKDYTTWNNTYLYNNKTSIESENLDECNISELKKEIEKYEETISNQKGYILNRPELEASVFDNYVDEIFLRTEIIVFKYSDNLVDDFVNKKFKKIIEEKLKPEKEQYMQTIDCNMLKLFKNGSIDWKTLQSLTYSNCKI